MAERAAKVQHEAQGAAKQKGHNPCHFERGERENADANEPPHRLLPSYQKREVHREGGANGSKYSEVILD
jgi:hypothetical protein